MWLFVVHLNVIASFHTWTNCQERWNHGERPCHVKPLRKEVRQMYFPQYDGLYNWACRLFSSLLCASGHETKAMMNNSGPRYKRSQLEKRLNTDVLWCVLLLIIMCLTGAVGVYPPWLTNPLLLLHNIRVSNLPIFNHPILRVMSYSGVSVFFRSRPLGEEPQEPDLWDRYRDVSRPCWILCLLDYDHCAAGRLLTVFSQGRNHHR